MPNRAICSEPGCDRTVSARELCATHYHRFQQSPAFTRKIASHDEIIRFVQNSLSTETDECVIWPFRRTPKGYAFWSWVMDWWRGSVSRYICFLEHGEPPTPHHEAAHSCGNGASGCINRQHLRWATPLDNAEDQKRHGKTKLTWEAVRAMRKMRVAGATERAIAARFDVSRSTAHHVLSNKLWKEDA